MPCASRASTVVEGENEPQRMQQKRKGEAGEHHAGERTPLSALQRLAIRNRSRSEQGADDDQQRTDQARKISRPHCIGAAGLELAPEPQAEQAEGHVEISGEKILAEKDIHRKGENYFCRAFTRPASSRIG